MKCKENFKKKTHTKMGNVKIYSFFFLCKPFDTFHGKFHLCPMDRVRVKRYPGVVTLAHSQSNQVWATNQCQPQPRHSQDIRRNVGCKTRVEKEKKRKTNVSSLLHLVSVKIPCIVRYDKMSQLCQMVEVACVQPPYALMQHLKKNDNFIFLQFKQCKFTHFYT